MNRLPTLADKVAIVTGADRGIGGAMAERLADAGAAVVLAYYDQPEHAAFLAERIEASGGRATTYAADLSIVEANRELVAYAVTVFGRLDIFAANAGLTVSQPFLEMDEQTWNMVVDLNLKGSYFGAQAAARQMISQEQQDGYGGRIIFSSSVTGIQAIPNMSAYGMTKAGLRHIAKVLAVELGSYNITVNALGIGATINERNLQNDPDYDAHWASVIPAGRVGKPIDVAEALLFLASPASAMITGHTLTIDGGWSMYSPVP